MKKHLLALVAFGFALAPVGQAKIIYENASSPLGKTITPCVEFGDQIILDTGFYPTAKINSFIFEYLGVGFSGDETARIRFYKNDGPLGKPGSLIFDSQAFEIPEAPTGASVDLGDLGLVVVPSSFTWTITYTGIDTAAGESAGLNLYSPSTVGRGFTDYWERQGNDWSLKSFSGADSSFAAIIDGVPVIPEPSTIALGIAGLAVLVFASRRK